GRPGCRTAARGVSARIRAFNIVAFWVCLSRFPVDGPHGKNVDPTHVGGQCDYIWARGLSNFLSLDISITTSSTELFPSEKLS
ncbi:uncharacterized protein EI90DRAFT_2979133, partial [Cantharellus anzutake]|uniref:uncharacterized protein n=1 Tax=Cantharellus anzutake TaxID=1750568 RepID=UPI001903B9EF